MSNGEFLTDSGYAGAVRKSGGMTPAAEDYLEMIYRLTFTGENEEAAAPRPVRICELAERLHVSPSSASRMAQSMSLSGHIDFKRYGFITLTQSGLEAGAYLIHRHKIVLAFLEWLHAGEAAQNCFEETERIEHYLSRETVAAMERKMEAVKEEKPP